MSVIRTLSDRVVEAANTGIDPLAAIEEALTAVPEDIISGEALEPIEDVEITADLGGDEVVLNETINSILEVLRAFNMIEPTPEDPE